MRLENYPRTMQVLSPGTQIGEYRIVRLAGRGAVGVVYVAEHQRLGRTVALKTLSDLVANEPAFRERFQREARSAATIDHPNIIPIYDAGEEDGTLYLVMKYVEGPDVEAVLNAGGLGHTAALDIAEQVASALDAAGSTGLAHRDVKPANILLEGWGGPGRPHVYLTDFGLTKHASAAALTRTGQFVGTLLYMAPEQIRGDAQPASDQYSLACVLWELLTSRPPYTPEGGSNLSLLSAHLSQPIPSISAAGGLPAALDAVFERALAKEPGGRYPTCSAFVAAVRQVLVGPASPAAANPALAPTEPRGTPLPQGVPGGGTARPPPADPPPGQGLPPGFGSTVRMRPDQLPPVAGSPGTATPGGPPPLGVPGLPPGAVPPATGPGGGGRRVLWIVLAVLLLVAVAVAVALVLASGDDDPATSSGEVATATTGTAAPTATAAATGATEAGGTPEATATEEVTAPAGPVPATEQGLVAVVVATPDGDDIALATADGARLDTVVSAAGDDRQPAWRPGSDGTELAFSAERGPEGRAIHLLDLDSGEERRVSAGGGDADPAWSPDGRRIVFSRGGTDLVVVDVASGAEEPLGAAVEGGANLFRPAWSPDGASIVFQMDVGGDLGIWAVDATPGGDAPRVVADQAGARDFHPAWRSATEVVFTSDRGGASQLWAVDVQGGGDPILLVAVDGAFDGDVAPCGDHVAFVHQIPEGDTRVEVVTLDGDTVGELPAGTSDPGWSGQACPSP